MVLKKKEAKFQPSGEIKRIVSLGGGSHAYVFDLNGKTHRLKTDSDEIVTLLRDMNEQTGGKTRDELLKLGWTDLIMKMEADATEDE
jgi:hypothetical protein